MLYLTGMVHNICDRHSLASVFLEQLRDVQKQMDPLRFRENLLKLGQIFAYEISKTLKYEPVKTETQLGTAISYRMTDEVVLLTILRAGLPMHQGMLRFFGDVQNGFVATQRHHHKDGSFEIHLDYVNCPEVDNRVVILCDAMLATGSSIVRTLEAIHEVGTPQKVHVVSAIASSYGIDYTRRLWPKAQIWIAAEDQELTGKSYIVPGLGDAGDLAYGGKRTDD